MSEKRSAPAVNEGAPNHPTADDSTPRHDSALAAAAGYAVLVETGEGRYRRRLFLTLASAERAVNRARDRGKYAHLVLVTLTPTAVIQ
ncbi:hypothetical protein GCM10009831_15210 [Dietzia cercidiphylli]|uniref:SPOR domain-containing protein n=1 Tax=Dietzia cercidiphylli TaxID=498199 RepID=A0ABP4UKP9_9ACTN